MEIVKNIFLYLNYTNIFYKELDRLKKKIIEDFQRLDGSQGSWIITFEDFKSKIYFNIIIYEYYIYLEILELN